MYRTGLQLVTDRRQERNHARKQLARPFSLNSRLLANPFFFFFFFVLSILFARWACKSNWASWKQLRWEQQQLSTHDNTFRPTRLRKTVYWSMFWCGHLFVPYEDCLLTEWPAHLSQQDDRQADWQKDGQICNGRSPSKNFQSIWSDRDAVARLATWFE